MAAKVVSPSVVVGRSGCSTGVDGHAADGIFHSVEDRERRRMMRRPVRVVIGIHDRRDLGPSRAGRGGTAEVQRPDTWLDDTVS